MCYFFRRLKTCQHKAWWTVIQLGFQIVDPALKLLRRLEKVAHWPVDFRAGPVNSSPVSRLAVVHFLANRRVWQFDIIFMVNYRVSHSTYVGSFFRISSNGLETKFEKIFLSQKILRNFDLHCYPRLTFYDLFIFFQIARKSERKLQLKQNKSKYTYIRINNFWAFH